MTGNTAFAGDGSGMLVMSTGHSHDIGLGYGTKSWNQDGPAEAKPYNSDSDLTHPNLLHDIGECFLHPPEIIQTAD